MSKETRLKMILAYLMSGQKSFAACDIPTRNTIEDAVKSIMKVFKEKK